MFSSHLNKIFILFLFLIVSLSDANLAIIPDSCNEAEDACQSYRRFSYVFSGKLTKVEDNQYHTKYIFKTENIYKGSPNVWVECISLKRKLCLKGPLLSQEGQYLVFVRTFGNENYLINDIYFNTKLLSESELELKILGENGRRRSLNPKFCKKDK